MKRLKILGAISFALISSGLIITSATSCNAFTKKFSLTQENIDKHFKKITASQKCYDKLKNKKTNESDETFKNRVKNFLLSNTQAIGMCFGYLEYFATTSRRGELISIDYLSDRFVAHFI
jgi:uncharacterized protein (DUF342 family)